MIHEFLEIAKEVGIALGLDIMFKKFYEKGADKASEAVIKKITEEHRAELLSFIRHLGVQYDKESSENLLRRQRLRQTCSPIPYNPTLRYQHGSEDSYVNLLTKLYIALNDSDKERNDRIEIFKWLGRLNEQDFDATLEFLNHDAFIQWMKRSWGWIKEAFRILYSMDPASPGLYQKIDVKIEPEIKSINNDLESWLNKRRTKYGRQQKTYR